MFKKERDLTQRSTILLKNKEIKNLCVEVLKQFQSLTENEINEFFNKKASVAVIKLASRSLIYTVNDIPFLFDKEGRNDLYPTVYFLWRFPHALRNIIVHSPVSDFILNGADLMLPGLASIKSTSARDVFFILVLFYDYCMIIIVVLCIDLEGMMKGDKVCIRVLGNPLPFAVGDAQVTHLTVVTYGEQLFKIGPYS